jgi:hypothetical protein
MRLRASSCFRASTESCSSPTVSHDSSRRISRACRTFTPISPTKGSIRGLSRDLPPAEITPIEELDENLNFRDVPYFSAIAVNGGGVFETLRSVASLVLSRLSAPAVGES